MAARPCPHASQVHPQVCNLGCCRVLSRAGRLHVCPSSTVCGAFSAGCVAFDTVLQRVQRHATWVLCRPWEAPEHVLQDAGVELGVNYPYPVVTAEESEAALARASEVIQQSIVSHNSDVRPVILLPPLRPFSFPVHGNAACLAGRFVEEDSMLC